MMSAALGLEVLVEARQRLRQRRLDRGKQVRTAEDERREWFPQVEELDDERARACAQAVGKSKATTWDLDAVELVLEGALEPDGEGVIALLRELATLPIPSAEEVKVAADELRAATEAVREVEQTDAGRVHRRPKWYQLFSAKECHPFGQRRPPGGGLLGASNQASWVSASTSFSSLRRSLAR